MANAFNKAGVWVLDTASATALTSGNIYIKDIRWDDATTPNHKAVLQNASGDIIWQSTAAGADNEDVQIIEGWYSGLAIPTLDSGTVLVRLG